MTTKQQRLLKEGLGTYANTVNNAPILNLVDDMQECFEENESDNASTLGTKLGDVILNSGMVGLQEHQLTDFYAYWTGVAEAVKSA